MPDKVQTIEIRCLTCGTWFPSPIFFGDFASFDSSHMSGNVVNCPNGHFTACNKENMRVRHEHGGFIGDDTV
jgi:hypothetical protein